MGFDLHVYFLIQKIISGTNIKIGASQGSHAGFNNQESGYCSNVSDSDEKSIDFCERVQHHLIVFS
jgi:hypothetical protein